MATATTVVCEGVADIEIWVPPKKNSADYCRIHRRVKAVRGPAHVYPCIQCGGRARTWAWQHGANPMTIYSYEPMCYSCHNVYDYTEETRAKQSAARRGRPNPHSIGNTHNRGAGNGMAKLTAADVLEIRRLAGTGRTCKDIGAVFGMHPASVAQIVRRDRWKHI